MPEPYEVEWAAIDVLVIRRRGFLTLEQAEAYFAEVKREIRKAPIRWGLVVDTSESAAQGEEVTAVLQEQMEYTASSSARRVSVVTGRAVASMQTKRLNATAKYAPDVISFHESFKEAYADVRRFLDGQ